MIKKTKISTSKQLIGLLENYKTILLTISHYGHFKNALDRNSELKCIEENLNKLYEK